jgi:Rrf2 family protein
MSAARNALPGVIVPARLDYALRAMLSLAAASADRTKLEVIAGEHGLSRKFLAHTLTTLRDAGLVVTWRGATGGYRLARPASDISVAEVFDAISKVEPAGPTRNRPGASAAARTTQAWSRIERAVREGLGAVTIAELVAPATPGRAPRP